MGHNEGTPEREVHSDTVLKLFCPFEGNCEAPSENEFDSPAVCHLFLL